MCVYKDEENDSVTTRISLAFNELFYSLLHYGLNYKLGKYGLVNIQMVWKESDTQRSITSGLGFHDIIEGTGHVLIYGDDAKLG